MSYDPHAPDPYAAPPGPPSMLPRILSHAAALALGAVLGIGGARMAEYMEDPVAMSRPEGSLSRAQLIARLDAAEKARAEIEGQLATKSEEATQASTALQEAGQKVTVLETKVSDTEGEIKILELKVKKSQGKSAALQKQLEDKLSELETLKAQLDVALEQKAQLQVELKDSKEETRVAREETEDAKRETDDARIDAVNAKWEGFQSQAMVDICEKGSRSKLSKCRDEVLAGLSQERAGRFKQCVLSGQASPRLLKVDPKVKDAQLPKWSEWFNEAGKFTKKNWYIVFCDPTLPEASGNGNAARRSEPLLDLDDEEL